MKLKYPLICGTLVAGYLAYSACMLPVYAVSGGNERSSGCSSCHGSGGTASPTIGGAIDFGCNSPHSAQGGGVGGTNGAGGHDPSGEGPCGCN